MGTASLVGLLTGVLSLAREPVRLTLRVWEFGLSSGAESARLGLELIDPDRHGSPAGFAEYRAGSPPAYGGNGDAPPAAAPPDTAPPAAAPEPDRAAAAPEPDRAAAGPADAPPAVPDELVPDHVDEEPVLVAEAAEEGAEEGAGPELHVDPPWEAYDDMTAADIRDRLAAASATEAAAVELYEATRKNRRSVVEAAERALRA
jgi:hypothetical protein